MQPSPFQAQAPEHQQTPVHQQAPALLTTAIEAPVQKPAVEASVEAPIHQPSSQEPPVPAAAHILIIFINMNKWLAAINKTRQERNENENDGSWGIADETDADEFIDDHVDFDVIDKHPLAKSVFRFSLNSWTFSAEYKQVIFAYGHLDYNLEEISQAIKNPIAKTFDFHPCAGEEHPGLLRCESLLCYLYFHNVDWPDRWESGENSLIMVNQYERLYIAFTLYSIMYSKLIKDFKIKVHTASGLVEISCGIFRLGCRIGSLQLTHFMQNMIKARCEAHTPPFTVLLFDSQRNLTFVRENLLKNHGNDYDNEAYTFVIDIVNGCKDAVIIATSLDKIKSIWAWLCVLDKQKLSLENEIRESGFKPGDELKEQYHGILHRLVGTNGQGNQIIEQMKQQCNCFYNVWVDKHPNGLLFDYNIYNDKKYSQGRYYSINHFSMECARARLTKEATKNTKIKRISI